MPSLMERRSPIMASWATMVLAVTLCMAAPACISAAAATGERDFQGIITVTC